jgi:hypothetical protein
MLHRWIDCTTTRLDCAVENRYVRNATRGKVSVVRPLSNSAVRLVIYLKHENFGGDAGFIFDTELEQCRE